MSNTYNKKYSINISNNTNNNIDNNGIKPKEELDSMRKSLFYGNTNKKFNSNEAIIDLKKSNNINSKLLNNDNKQNEDNSGQQNQKRLVCKSKGKSNNNLVGKETKAYIPNKRNQSTNQVKRRVFKSTLDANNARTNKNNIQ